MGCQSGQTEVKDEKKKDEMRIGITFDTFVLERWIRDRDVFVSTAEKLGATVDVQNANGDVEKQIGHIRRFIEQEMDAIVVIAVDCYEMKEVVQEAKARGIIVVSYDRMIQEEPTDLYVTVDNGMVGKKMAQEVKTRLPEGGNVVMICGPKSDTNSIDVESSFEAELADGPWKIIYKNYVKSWTPENGFAAVTEAFENVTDVDAVMCGNDGLAGYAIRALSERQMAGKVILVGQDADLEACQRVVEGTQTMTVYKPIEELARVAAECTVELVQGKDAKDIEKVNQTKELDNGEIIPYCGLEPVAVTKENMDSVIIDSGFHLREEVYLNLQENE